MGYEPDECPEELMNKALALEKKMGTAALSELAPVYGRPATQTPLAAIEEIAESHGLIGVPTAAPCVVAPPPGCAVAACRRCCGSIAPDDR